MWFSQPHRGCGYGCQTSMRLTAVAVIRSITISVLNIFSSSRNNWSCTSQKNKILFNNIFSLNNFNFSTSFNFFQPIFFFHFSNQDFVQPKKIIDILSLEQISPTTTNFFSYSTNQPHCPQTWTRCVVVRTRLTTTVTATRLGAGACQPQPSSPASATRTCATMPWLQPSRLFFYILYLFL